MVFILALSVGNHLMAFLAAPALVIFVLLVHPRSLWNARLYLAAVVALTSLVFPLVKILGQIYVLSPIRHGYIAPGTRSVFRFLMHIRAWSMTEIFMLGMLVAFVKLSGMAEIVPGIALWAFASLVVFLAWSSTALEPKLVWDRIAELQQR